MTVEKAACQSGWDGDALANSATMVKRDMTFFAIATGNTSVTLAMKMLACCVG